MSKKILITFSGSRYHLTTKKIVEDGPRLGCDKVWVYDDAWLKTQTEHCAKTKWAFDDPNVRGVNWFAFKSYCIQHALGRCDVGDTVLFIDADTVPIADMTPLYDMAEKSPIILFAACNHSQKYWSKKDCNVLMGADHEWLRNRQAGVARFMLFKKGGSITYAPEERDPANSKRVTVDQFLNEWLDWSCDQRASTFEPSKLYPEYTDGFIQHRTEQAILTNLSYKYNIPLHREADQWGNDFQADFPFDTYDQIFESTGVYSYDPSGKRDGSSFRNVE